MEDKKKKKGKQTRSQPPPQSIKTRDERENIDTLMIDGKWCIKYIDNVESKLGTIHSPYVLHYQVFPYYDKKMKKYEQVSLVSPTVKTTLNDYILKHCGENEPLSLKMDGIELGIILEQIWLGMNHLRNIAKSIKAHCLHPANIHIQRFEDEKGKSHMAVKIMNYLTLCCYPSFTDEMKLFMHPSVLHAIHHGKLLKSTEADLYSFAFLVCYLYTGKYPLKEGTTVNMLMKGKYGKYIEIPSIEDPIVNQFVKAVLIEEVKWSNIMSNEFIKRICQIQIGKYSHRSFRFQNRVGNGTFSSVYLVKLDNSNPNADVTKS